MRNIELIEADLRHAERLYNKYFNIKKEVQRDLRFISNQELIAEAKYLIEKCDKKMEHWEFKQYQLNKERKSYNESR